ncbi:protoporphyrinogen oxidase [Microbacterium sp. GXF7504]
MTELDALASHAHNIRVAVVGGGVAGLVAALEFGKLGMSVTLLEAGDRVGGAIRSAEVGGLRLDVGAEAFATRGGHVRRLLAELGLEDAVVAPEPLGAWVAGVPGVGAAPLPRGGLLGIPENPWDPSVRRIIGWGGAWRAYLDRLRPPLTIGHDDSLGHLVRTRMGEKVLDRLVAPVTAGVYSTRPDDIDVDAAAPGLNAALTRAGSLSGAVGQLRAGRTAAPGSAVEGIDGGMTRLVDALAVRLHDLGVDVRLGSPVHRLERAAAGWTVHLADDAVPPGADEAARLDADVVVVATNEPTARRLLSPVVPALAPAAGAPPVLEIVTLVLDAPELDGAPRGTGVLTVPGAFAAKALTHTTAKWHWAARAAGPGVHAVRVSFGTQQEAPVTASLSDEDAFALALEDAGRMLGVRLDPARLRGAHRQRFEQSQPASVRGRAAAVAADRAAVRAVPGLAAVGSWLSGTGLAQVIPDAIAETVAARRSALWDGSGAE